MRCKPAQVLIDTWPERYKPNMRGIVRPNGREGEVDVRWDGNDKWLSYAQSEIEEAPSIKAEVARCFDMIRPATNWRDD